MANTVIYNRDHHAGATAEQRIENRLRSSSLAQGERATDTQRADASKTTMPTRTITNVYYPGSSTKHGGNNG